MKRPVRKRKGGKEVVRKTIDSDETKVDEDGEMNSKDKTAAEEGAESALPEVEDLYPTQKNTSPIYEGK